MNPTAIYSKTGKGVQEASGKTSILSRADRMVLAAIDGRATVGDINLKFDRMPEAKLHQLIAQLDKDGFIREVTAGTSAAGAKPAAPARPGVPPPAARPAAPPSADEELDFTSLAMPTLGAQKPPAPPPAPAAPAAKAPPPAAPPPKAPPKPPVIDLAAAAHAHAVSQEDTGEFDFLNRQKAEPQLRAEAEAKARAEAEAKAKAEEIAKARVAAEAKARAEAAARAAAEVKAKADAAAAAAKAATEADAKVKAAREAAVRMATEAKAKAEAEAKAVSEAAQREALTAKEAAEKAAREAEELRRQLEAERAKAKEEAERLAKEAEERIRREAEEKARAEAEALRKQLEQERARADAERKAREEEERRRKAEEERRAKEEAERKAREEEERRRREEEERRRKEEEARRAKEEAERKAREEEERRRREEEERRRKEEEERRAKEDAERKAREEEERRAKEEAERKAREAEERNRREEEERRAKEEAERRAREEEERKRRDEEERRRRDEDERRAQEQAAAAKAEAEKKAREDEERRAREEAERRSKEEADRRREEEERAMKDAEARRAAEAAKPQATPAAPVAPGFGDSLLADLDNFGKQEEEDLKAKEAAERKEKEAARAREAAEAERRQQAEAEEKRRDEEARLREEEEARLQQEELDRVAREEAERAAFEAEARKRKAKEGVAQAATRALKPEAEDDIPLSDDDLDLDDVKADEKALSADARKKAKEREREMARAQEGEASVPAAARAARKPVQWGKPVAVGVFVLLVAGIGAVHVMPVGTADYEKAASEALGMPVKIGGARLSLYTGLQLNLEKIDIGGGAVKIASIKASPSIGTLTGPQKSFSRMDMEGVVLRQDALGGIVLGTGKPGGFSVARITAAGVKLEGPLALAAVDVDATTGAEGRFKTIRLSGGDKISGTIVPRGNDASIELTAGAFPLPFGGALTLNDFGMKGTLSREGMDIAQFDSRMYDGVVAGSARVRWGAAWKVDGEVRVKNINAAVIAPALVSEGRLDGRGTYAMGGADPARLGESLRVDGTFTVTKAVIGSFDFARAVQSGGAQTGGRTQVSEFNGKVSVDGGNIAVRDIAIVAGALGAAISLDIDGKGALSGRVVADLKTPAGTLRGVYALGGSYKDPTLRK